MAPIRELDDAEGVTPRPESISICDGSGHVPGIYLYRYEWRGDRATQLHRSRLVRTTPKGFYAVPESCYSPERPEWMESEAKWYGADTKKLWVTKSGALYSLWRRLLRHKKLSEARRVREEKRMERRMEYFGAEDHNGALRPSKKAAPLTLFSDFLDE